MFPKLYLYVLETKITSILKLHPDYDPRKERATLLRLSDLSSPDANKNSSYSYLISLGMGESLSSILNNVVDQNDQVEKVRKCNAGMALDLSTSTIICSRIQQFQRLKRL